MANKKYTYDNWLNGKFDYDHPLLSKGFITPDDYKLMLDKSYDVVIAEGKEEFNRLKANCIKRIQEGEKKESFTKSAFLRIENDYYNLLLNKRPSEENGYLKLSDSRFNKFTQYDVALIRSVQKYHSWLTDGKINLIIPNPVTEKYNPNSGNDYTCAVLAVAWRYYRNYLKELSTKKDSAISPMNIAIFCRLLVDLKIEELGDNQESFCKKMCSKYKLTYKERVRINFSTNPRPTSKQLTNLKNTVIPIINNINNTLAEKLTSHIDNKTNNKNKMYA